MNSQSEPTTYAPVPCPSCGRTVPAPGHACPACGLSLTGPVAGRLWQVDQQLTALRAERVELLARLREQGSAAPAPYPRYPVPGPAADPEWHRRSLSGQQVILGLGALLLISAAALFTVVVWLVVGLVGQAAILVALTAAAVTASRLAARRALPAAAEAAAVIAVGLTLVGANAAHARGLAGLDRVPFDWYWAVALVVCGCLFVGFDRAVPSGPDDRGVWTYLPAASAALSAAPWFALSALDLGAFDEPGLTLQVCVGIAGVVLGAGALVAWLSARRTCARVAAALAGLVALAATALFVVLGVALAYDGGQPTVDRYVAAALLLGAAAASRWVPDVRVMPAALATTAGILAPALVLEAPYELNTAASLVVAGACIALLRSWRADSTWRVSLTVCLLWIQVVLWVAVAYAAEQSTAAVLTDETVTVWWWAPVLPAAALLAVSGWGLGLFRRAEWVLAVQAAVAVTAWSALREAPAVVAFGVLLLLMSFEMVVAVAAVRAARPLEWLLSSGRAGVGAVLNRAVLDRVALVAAAGYFVAACDQAMPAAAEVGPSRADLTALACYAAAVLVFVYAGQRHRLGFAYLGSALSTAGTWTLLGQGGVTVVEAYTLPLAALLGLVGAATHLQARREGRVAGSMLTMGPALAVALGPSTLVGVTDGGVLRVVLVVAAGLVCVVGGFVARLKAPVLAGTAALCLVAVTEGGPYLSYVPGWVTIGAAGALLLAVGVSWEQAVVAGRRSTAWFSALG
ncbi:hypothetical protein GCM10009798_09790 [Nocardioides panacihumi]|uniref:DUF2157 domain-containing protein n=1 Tax=Nocardioides panacihumi TaxID=400774 RepID=A0ABN2QHP0_9ACTN